MRIKITIQRLSRDNVTGSITKIKLNGNNSRDLADIPDGVKGIDRTFQRVSVRREGHRSRKPEIDRHGPLGGDVPAQANRINCVGSDAP